VAEQDNEPMQRPVSLRRRMQKDKRWRSLAFVILVGAFVSIAAGSAPIRNPNLSQLAAATAPPSSSDGGCQQKYQQCKNDPDLNNDGGKYCEENWKTCVNLKCVNALKFKGGSLQCVKDSDCQSSCTESATRGGVLSSCCKGGPQHNNGCPTEIAGNCIPMKESSKLFRGPSYGEGDVIPSEQPVNTHIDGDIILGPPLQYPVDTIFDEYGNASKPPLPRPEYVLKEFDPIVVGFDYTLPPEYRPTPDEFLSADKIVKLNNSSSLAPSWARSDPSNNNIAGPALPVDTENTFSDVSSTKTAPSGLIQSIYQSMRNTAARIVSYFRY